MGAADRSRPKTGEASRRGLQAIQRLLTQHGAIIAAFPAREKDFLLNAEVGVRWTRYRKTLLVKALAADEIGLEEALARFTLSADELTGWIEKLVGGGVDGLRALHLRVETGA